MLSPVEPPAGAGMQLSPIALIGASPGLHFNGFSTPSEIDWSQM